MTTKKKDLPVKICAACQRPFSWRKKWEKVWEEVKTWCYAALSGTEQRPDDVNARNFEKFLDSPHRVIIETEANLVVSFDVAKFNEFTARAIAAGLGVE